MQGAQYSSSSTSNESSSSSSSEQQHNGSNGETTDATTADAAGAARSAELRKYAQHLVLQYRATLHLNAGAEGGQRVSATSILSNPYRMYATSVHLGMYCTEAACRHTWLHLQEHASAVPVFCVSRG
jgi:hypothetical protein